jgi:Family of unknown function (DUF6533)
VFDTLLTLPSEVMYIWCRKVKLGAVFYVLARYTTLVVFTLELYVSFFEGQLQVSKIGSEIMPSLNRIFSTGLPSLRGQKTDLEKGPVI